MQNFWMLNLVVRKVTARFLKVKIKPNLAAHIKRKSLEAAGEYEVNGSKKETVKFF
jgi:hypothetical protein